MNKKPLSFAGLWNMNFGFMGIQFGWGLQLANMSAIYEFLGANADEIPILWLAAPLTGLLVQPIIGHLSDLTWSRLGRRRPYFLGGTIAASIALAVLPHSTEVWMAATFLWMLDLSVNVSMEPFRAFVADILPPEQRAQGYAMQSLFIGLGAVMGSALPWVLTQVFHVAAATDGRAIPDSVRYAFYVGSVVYFLAVMWTVATTKEYPPHDLEAFRRERVGRVGLGAQFREMGEIFSHLPQTMRQLAWVQLFTWFGLFCMWIYFAVAVARSVFGATDEKSALFTEGVEWGGICFAVYNGVCLVFSILLLKLARIFSPKAIHAICLAFGAVGLVSVAFMSDKYMLLVSMVGVGIAWASIVSMPYAMLSGALPEEKMGVYMGIFNFFIVIPQIIASFGLGWVMQHLLGNDRMLAVVVGGISIGIAALLTLRVKPAAAPPIQATSA
jgi:maltose/moltooligosaccharide transporter